MVDPFLDHLTSCQLSPFSGFSGFSCFLGRSENFQQQSHRIQTTMVQHTELVQVWSRSSEVQTG